ncbi:TECTA protein, partial [Polypterus senegalus]
MGMLIGSRPGGGADEGPSPPTADSNNNIEVQELEKLIQPIQSFFQVLSSMKKLIKELGTTAQAPLRLVEKYLQRFGQELPKMVNSAVQMNSIHFIHKNTIVGSTDDSLRTIITRTRQVNISFVCVFPISEQVSMTVMNPAQSMSYEELPGGVGHCQVSLIAFHDVQLHQPFTGGVIDIELNEKVYISTSVFGDDETKFARMLDSGWATPEADPGGEVHWDLIEYQYFFK